MTTSNDVAKAQHDAQFDEEFAKALAQSEEAFARYQRTLSSIERQHIGEWYGFPEKFRGWSFYRCGMRPSPVAQALAQLLRAQGWTDAPKGLRQVGMEIFDGEDGGLYLMAPPGVYQRMKAIEAEAIAIQRRTATSSELDGFISQLEGVAGVAIDSFEVKSGEDTLENVSANVQTRSRRPPKRP